MPCYPTTTAHERLEQLGARVEMPDGSAFGPACAGDPMKLQPPSKRRFSRAASREPSRPFLTWCCSRQPAATSGTVVTFERSRATSPRLSMGVGGWTWMASPYRFDSSRRSTRC